MRSLYPKLLKSKILMEKIKASRKDNNSYPKFSVLSEGKEGTLKASHTSLIPSFKIKDFNKPSSYLLKPRKDTCSYLFFCTTFEAFFFNKFVLKNKKHGKENKKILKKSVSSKTNSFQG